MIQIYEDIGTNHPDVLVDNLLKIFDKYTIIYIDGVPKTFPLSE